MKLKAIIVDDEESARNVLSNLLLRFCPQVEVIETCTNVVSAVEKIKQLNPDVVFLDIEMPNYAGYEIVSFFDEVNFEIVFVTAYDKYAIKAFEISAVDYLLKPIEIDRLKQAVEKLTKQIQINSNKDNYKTLTETLQNDSPSKIVVRNNSGQQIIAIKDIIAIEAQESYSCIYTMYDQFLMSKNLKFYESLLNDSPDFFRSHKSWLINLSHLKSFSKSKSEIQLTNNIVARLSKYKKPEFEDLILQ